MGSKENSELWDQGLPRMKGSWSTVRCWVTMVTVTLLVMALRCHGEMVLLGSGVSVMSRARSVSQLGSWVGQSRGSWCRVRLAWKGRLVVHDRRHGMAR